MLRRGPASDRLHPCGLGAFRTLLHFVADPLAFLRAAEARGVDGGKMHEHVGAAVLGGDETEALGIVEPLHCAVLHDCEDLLRMRVVMDWIGIVPCCGTARVCNSRMPAQPC